MEGGLDRDRVKLHVKKLPGQQARKWTRFHMKHTAVSTLEEGFVWARDKPALGPWCTDVDGNIILDFVSHVASAPLGYNHPRIIDLMKQFHAADPDRYAGTDFIAGYSCKPEKCSVPTPAHLHKKIVDITKQFKFDTAFFSNSGAEAVENAIKICYDYRQTDGYAFCFQGAFHGRTLGALSLNRSKTVQKLHFPQIPDVVAFPFCSCVKKCVCGWKTQSKKNKIENVLHQSLDNATGIINSEDVAYIIIEPIQGEGGYNVPRLSFIKEVYKEAKKHGIPVISDEIQSGLGRTGKWWACEHFGVKPDVITSAKGLRVGATIAKRRMFPAEKGRISSTWAEGNALASAVGWMTIDIIQKEKLMRNATRVGNYFMKRLRELMRRSRKVVDVRGKGLMVAAEFDTKRTRDHVRFTCFKRGVLLNNVGYKSIRFLPPLNVTKREVDVCVDVLGKVLRGRDE
jgi:4-aminobutyrate aminotransferase